MTFFSNDSKRLFVRTTTVYLPNISVVFVILVRTVSHVSIKDRSNDSFKIIALFKSEM